MEYEGQSGVSANGYGFLKRRVMKCFKTDCGNGCTTL
jgi:hypothetical protein